MPHRHCERSEAIQLSARGAMDCFVALAPRNDGDGTLRLPHRLCGLRLELLLAHHAVAAGSLGLIHRAVAALDQIIHRLAEQELADADRHRYAWQLLAGGAAGDLAF